MINNLEVSVFAYEDEKKEIKDALLKLFPFEADKFLTVKKAIGFNERPIFVFSLFLNRRSLAKKALFFIVGKLSKADRVYIQNTIESHLSKSLHFYFRLDKKSWLEEKAKITEEGDCFRYKISFLAFPRRRETAVDEIFKTFL